MTLSTEPTTAAGRELLFDTRGRTASAASDNLMVNAILAIEAEARAEQAATIEALRGFLAHKGSCDLVANRLDPRPQECTCGLRALLADTAKASEGWLARHDAEVRHQERSRVKDILVRPEFARHRDVALALVKRMDGEA